MRQTLLPEAITHAYELALKRHSKLENQKIIITSKSHNQDKEIENDVDGIQEGKKSDVKNQKDVIFEGYATVIPIRGKKSSLDYYLMVLSLEIMT